jgi:DNA polymerase III gamma/tau subunit
MGFSEFVGNGRVVTALKGMLAAERVPSAMLFSGPRGIGKYTLATISAESAPPAKRLCSSATRDA